jgi:uncharacterized protein (DUF433 family)
MAAATVSHIWLAEDGRAWIDDTNTKVIEVVCDHTGWGMSAEDICREYPYLSLGQVYAALAYYYDHQAEFDAEIEAQLKRIDELKAQADANSPGLKRLRALGKLP